jgi:hypothetical protein
MSRFLFRVGLGVLTALPILAQKDAPVVRTGNTEVGGFGGLSFGNGETRFMGGGNVAYALTRVVMPYAEVGYFPGIGRKLVSPLAGSRLETRAIPITDFHAGVHLRVPTKDSRVVPYAVIGAGLLHSPTRQERFFFGSGANDFIPLTVPSRSDFAVNFGGGLRFYVNERFGFRMEGKMYKPSGQFSDVFGKFEGGVFLQLK